MNKIPYIGLEIQLHSCVENLEQLVQEIRNWLKDKLNPDYESDVIVEITESAGFVDKDV